MSHLLAAPPGRRSESEINELWRRIRNLEARMAHQGAGTTTIVTGAGSGGQTGSQRQLGYILEQAIIASDGRTVLWVATNTLTNGPPTVMATLP